MMRGGKSYYAGATSMFPLEEAVKKSQVVIVSYQLIKVGHQNATFWINIDPTQANGQFADKGAQYRTAIFYHDNEQKEKAFASKKELEDSGKFNAPIVTIIEPIKNFYEAEEYHQNYYEKNPIHYNLYKKGSGREGYIKRTWGK